MVQSFGSTENGWNRWILAFTAFKDWSEVAEWYWSDCLLERHLRVWMLCFLLQVCWCEISLSMNYWHDTEGSATSLHTHCLIFLLWKCSFNVIYTCLFWKSTFYFVTYAFNKIICLCTNEYMVPGWSHGNSADVYSKYLFPRAMNSLQTCKQKAVLVRLNTRPKKSRKTKLFITWKTTCLFPKLYGFIDGGQSDVSGSVFSVLTTGSAVRECQWWQLCATTFFDAKIAILICVPIALRWTRCLVETALGLAELFSTACQLW